MRSWQGPLCGGCFERIGRIRILKRKGLEEASCECYEVIREHFERLGFTADEAGAGPTAPPPPATIRGAKATTEKER